MGSGDDTEEGRRSATDHRGEEDKVRESSVSSPVSLVLTRFQRITEKLQGLGYTIDDFPVLNKAWQKLMRESKEVTECGTCRAITSSLRISSLQYVTHAA